MRTKLKTLTKTRTWTMMWTMSGNEDENGDRGTCQRWNLSQPEQEVTTNEDGNDGRTRNGREGRE